MKISTRGRYALRLMMDVAVFSKDAPVRIKDVAQRQQISEKYLEQIVSVLNKAGFVKSSRGPQGGYRLMKKPEDYTTGMILRLIEEGKADSRLVWVNDELEVLEPVKALGAQSVPAIGQD